MSVTRNYYTRLRASVSRLTKTYRANKLERYAIIGFIIANISFISAHVIYTTLVNFSYIQSWMKEHRIRIDIDRGYAELFNYLQLMTCVMLLFRAFAVSGQRIYTAWALVFLFVFLDDALLLHEQIGKYLDAAFALPTLPGLRPRDTGELMVWGAAGAFLLPTLIWGFRNSTPEAVEFGVLFTFIFALLVFFAVGIDMLHIAIGNAFRFTDTLLTVAEDGGEMLATVLACACSLLLCRYLSTHANTSILRHSQSQPQTSLPDELTG